MSFLVMMRSRLGTFLLAVVGTLALGSLLGASNAGCSGPKSGPRSYGFTAGSAVRLESTSIAPEAAGAPLTTKTATPGLHAAGLRPQNTFDDNNLCNSVVCFTPEALTGKYFAVGLSIQSDGHGMMAFFGQDNWSTIDAKSPTYDFDFRAPFTQAGKLSCCAGQGNLQSQNTYIESVAYLFGYMDATFTIPDGSGAHGSAVGTHTVRFVLADDAVATAKRGDVQYKDADGAFKWMDASSGALSATRPGAPITMPSTVVSWANPFGPQAGNQNIPVLYQHVDPPSTGGVYVVTETQLRADGHSYAFDFGAKNFVMFPRLLKASGDIGRLESVKAVLENVITQGLPDGMHPDGAAGTTALYLDGSDVGIAPDGTRGKGGDAASDATRDESDAGPSRDAGTE